MGNSVGVIAMFKNESHILEEWIKHYINEGVCQFILINNGSTDNFRHILKPYMNTLKSKIYLYDDNAKQQQGKLYNKYYYITCNQKSFKKCAWYIVCDLDEFIYSKNPKYKTIPEYLKKIPKKIGQIRIPWKMFGSNNYLKQPKSVIKEFTKRGNNGKKNYILGKCIFKSDALISIGIHNHKIKDNYLSVNSNLKNESQWKDTPGNCFISEDYLFWSQLVCNHYQYQSFEFWKNIKCTRGDAVHSINNRKIDRWNNIKHLNIINDEELKNKKY